MCLLGSHVTGGAEKCQRPCEIAGVVQPFGEAEVGHERFALFVQQDVSRLEVPVEQSHAMSVVDGTGNLCHQLHGLARRIPTGGLGLEEVAA